ncbi:MAG: class I tRNA ligase family protein [Candidatus Hodarchaeales archaeon]
MNQLQNYNGRDYVTHGFHMMLKEIEFYQKSAIGVPINEKQSALLHILDPWNLILSPMIPHVAEEINEKLGSNEFCSLRQMPEIEITEDSSVLTQQTSFIKSLMDDIQSIIDLKRDNPKKIVIYIAPDWKQELYSEISNILGTGSFNMGKVMGTIKKNPKFTSKMPLIAKELKSKRGDEKIFRRQYIGTQKELDAVGGYQKYLASNFNCPIEFYTSEDGSINDPMNKASRAQPTKPAIFMEF